MKNETSDKNIIMGATRTAVLHLLPNRIFWKHFVNGVQRLGATCGKIPSCNRTRLHCPRVNGIKMCYFNVYVIFMPIDGRVSCTNIDHPLALRSSSG